MAPRTLRLLPPLAAFIFAILALIFSLLAITSRKWAIRNNYDPALHENEWTTPIYTLYRSPFIVCSANQVDNAANSTASNATSSAATPAAATSTTDPSSTPSPSPIYQVDCTHYRPFGFNRTSCELEVATQTDTAETIGDSRLCQQIHYAGNFGIASTLFIGLGFLLSGTMVMMTFLNARRRSLASMGPGSRRVEGEQTQEDTIDKRPGATTLAANKYGGNPGARPSVIASYVNFVLVLFLFIGFATGIISQYFAVLGFIHSLPNQSDFASSAGVGASKETDVHGFHGPWFQGVGLSVYATCAWAFTAAAGVMASKTWHLPTWKMVL